MIGRVLTLIIEAIDTINARTLVIASQEKEVLRILNLVCEQKADGF